MTPDKTGDLQAVIRGRRPLAQLEHPRRSEEHTS